MRAKGIDISKYQAPQDLGKPHQIDFRTMLTVVDFLVLRAGYAGSAGGAWTDERVHEYMEDLYPELLKNPLPFTFYWYFRDDVNIMDQVNRFASVVNRYKDIVNLPLVVDAEIFVKSNDVSTQKIIDFQLEVERQTGLLVDILYARSWQLNNETSSGLQNVLPKLWIARYENDDPQDGQPWNIPPDNVMLKPRDYEEWFMWQHRANGTAADYGIKGGSTYVDEDVYNGTVEELRELAGLHEPADPPVDWGVQGTTKAFHETYELQPSELDVFVVNVEKGKELTPQTIMITGDKGVRYDFEVNIDGVPFVLRESTLYARGWQNTAEYALKPGDFIKVGLENPTDKPLKCSVSLAAKVYVY
jgi:GH25 family lysozyme M1 (1,4-beta-N-acetylmuramidase)